MSTPTIAPWSTEQVTALAPDKQVASAGLKLASPATWSDAGVHEALVWGSAAGSGKRPYRVCVDLSGPAFKCSCPSRKFPCKHAIGLLHLWSRGQVAGGEPAALSRLSDSSPDWPERLVDEFGLLHLLIRAWTRRDQLPDDLMATVRSHLGLTMRTEDVLAAPGVGDTWVVVAGRDSVEGRLTERRLWLYGTTTRRWGLVLLFAPASGGFSTALVPGTRLDAVAHFYPGRGQVRVALSDEQPPQPVTGWKPAVVGTAAAREIWKRAVAADPWVEATPVLVSGRFRLLDGDRLAIGDADGALPLITPDDARWGLPLLADGDETVVAGELSPEGLRALSVLTAGEVRAL